ncbi:1-(5-phosphoribosyl)-5-[(5-phosphoribosylamino)methylideneamino]imidazole-4-carboxamide isomerase [Tepidanaerobacter syntrophicus]|uniref:1-(5-phosphoribosyl)-5-[(5- phosphoribosylamino)methylideneamino]imidazole-4- carboxamide isomerase n=1 Tax=Tepidanaerobacter syntrophicus TaxID=224999 RepID=UPI001BD6341F|nr:1-(5-phosphoribosyl)-5-[(5-phosphoribosylamino)methylideneamino]imidazole-4-carboxamide isomerase [Tepidanaerobacter syntrophicus]GLI18206.1 1-(5-phosphoribosyl)-5-[(5-phosphoribosylamino) methylideneamino] imidazole-4-carboxamide isomerase [Tepidanaerobacter syntrophicus]
MNIYPAVDIMGGKCVRLAQGDFSKETVYFENPVDAAKHWQSQGAQWIHIVDLDGAKTACPVNFDIIEKIRKDVCINIQLGGGIRHKETVERYLNLGINRLVFGTSAVNNLKLIEETISESGPDKVAVGIDARGDEVAVEGWIKDSGIKVEELLKTLKNIGVKTIIYTDISRDGMMRGPNIAAIEKILDFGGFSVIASGGISSIKDLEELAKLEGHGLDGAIIGRALYDGTLDLKSVLKKFYFKKGVCQNE